MSPLKPNNPSTAVTEYSNITEAKGKDLQTFLINVIELLLGNE